VNHRGGKSQAEEVTMRRDPAQVTPALSGGAAAGALSVAREERAHVGHEQIGHPDAAKCPPRASSVHCTMWLIGSA